MVEEVVEVVVVPLTSPRAARSLQTAERVTGSVGWETETSRPYLRRSGSRGAAYRKLMGVKCLNLGQKQPNVVKVDNFAPNHVKLDIFGTFLFKRG